MCSKNFSLVFLLLLAGQAGQEIYAQQSFELPQASSKLTAHQAATRPKTKKPRDAFYTGNVKIISCTSKKAVGIDLATGKRVVIIPRFKGVIVGGIFHFDKNRILQNDREIVIAPKPGKEDYGPYGASPNTTQAISGAAGAAMQTAGAMLNLLNSFK